MKKLLFASLVLSLSLAVGRLGTAGPSCANENGEVNGDGGIDLSDAIYSLAFFFQGGGAPVPFCVAAGPKQAGCAEENGDTNGDGDGDLSDVIYSLAFLFQGGPTLVPKCQGGPEVEMNCNDNLDNDMDGLTDCFDDDCDVHPFCQPTVMVCDPGSPAPNLTGVGFEFFETNPGTGCHEYIHIGAGGGAGGQMATGMQFVLLPGGEFQMGSPGAEPDRDVDESPLHDVTLDSFLIAKYEVNQVEYEAVMTGHASLSPTPNAGSDPPTSDDDLPVGFVSWEDLNDPDGFLARTGLVLPTEAEWEYAARAGTAGPYGGTDDLDTVGWYNLISGGMPQPVGTLLPNPFGLHDMLGNVWEPCQDVYDADFYGKPAATAPDPLATGSGDRVIRGGSFSAEARDCRCANRVGEPVNARGSSLGFRPAAPVP